MNISTRKKLVLFGNGQVAAVAHAYFHEESEYEVTAFTVDRDYISEETFCGLPVLPFESITQECPPAEYDMFVSISFQQLNRLREAKYAAAKALGYQLATHVSPGARVWSSAEIGDNCMIMENNVIQPYVTIGNNVIMWSGNHVGHHTRIEDHCFIASHAVISGSVTVGKRCFVGVNATLRDNISIGEDCIIGAGALILKDTQPKEVHVGPRATRIKKRSDELENL